MTLKELMQLVYNAGLDGWENEQGFAEWWKKYGRDRHKAFCDLVDSDDRFLFEEDS